MSFLHRYVRHSASSKEQVHSRDAQLREMSEYIKSLPQTFGGMTDAGEYYDDETSGGTPFVKRTAGALLLGRCQPGDHIVVARFDRMCRKVKDLLWMIEWCIDNHVVLHLVDKRFDLSTATGRAMAQMCAVFAEWELGTCGERQKKTAQMLKHTKGISICYGRPIGWQRVRHHTTLNTLGHPYTTLVPFGPEREEAEKLSKLHDRGMSYAGIKRRLLRNGSKPVRSKDKPTDQAWCEFAIRKRIAAYKAGFPANPDWIDGKNREQLMIAVQQ